MSTKEFPHSEVDKTAPDWANVEHLRHVFEGYRTIVLGGDESCPYSPGSARNLSWKIGEEQARKDLTTRALPKDYEACGECGYDHTYEQDAAIAAHR